MGKHLQFRQEFIWTAILLGIFGGFALGAGLVFGAAFVRAPAISYQALAQIHGHLQLLGWTGFFIFGVSIYKLPRLMSITTFSVRWARAIFGLVLCGILLRSLAQYFLSLGSSAPALRSGIRFGSVLESVGICLYSTRLLPHVIRYSPSEAAVSAAAIKPFLMVNLFGWLIFAALNAAGAMFWLDGARGVINPAHNALTEEAYIQFILIPVCLAFSLGTLPIFLRLRAPDWTIARAAGAYFAGASIYLLGDAFGNSVAFNAGTVLRVGAVFWTVYELDLLRRKSPWFKKFRDNQDRPNRPPRRSAGDYGQFGNFEWLILSAYWWLVVAGLSDLLALAGAPIPSTIIRHLYLLGYVTHLILGMAVRMVPGFLGLSYIAYPSLVRASFAFITVSLLGRTLPVGLNLLDVPVFRYAYGLSGVFALCALGCLGMNIYITVRIASRKHLGQGAEP